MSNRSFPARTAAAFLAISLSLTACQNRMPPSTGEENAAANQWENNDGESGVKLSGASPTANPKNTDQRNVKSDIGESDAAAGAGAGVKAGYLPESDFYEYVNHPLLETTEIPADTGNWSYFYELSEKTYKDLNTVLQDTVENRAGHAPGSSQQKITDLYLTAMDTEGRKETGIGALAAYLAPIDSAQSIQEYVEAIAVISKEIDCHSLFPLTGEADMADSDRYVWYLASPDLGPGKETLENQMQANLVEQYEQYIAKLLTAYGREQAAATQAAKDIVAFQKELAADALPLNDAWNPSLVYNLYTKDQLSTLFSNMDVGGFLSAAGLNEADSIVVTQPRLAQKLNLCLTKDRLSTLKDYSIFCLLNDMALYLSPEIRDARLEYRRFTSGAKEIKTEEKLAGELVMALMPNEFGQLYVENYFSVEDRQAVEDLASKILSQYEHVIDGLDWMGAQTKAIAKKKLDAMTVKIGYPDRWPDDLSGAEILPKEEGGSLIYNVLEICRAAANYKRELCAAPVDKTLWQMSPQTVNAYYNPAANEIVFPAAILQPPFYTPGAGEAQNLGGIGTIIAHEITHAFDDTGSQYDEKGNCKAWWTDKDYEEFQKRAQAVSSYYSNFHVIDGLCVDGRQTLGENIADLGALSCVTSLVEQDPQALRLLFTQYATIWASKYSDQRLRQLLDVDVHSPAKVRVNAVLSSTAAFYKAYPDIQPGNEMYVEPDKRVKIW